ncbi:HAD-IA family hydrolase [Actinomycetospora straminea]|uniref:HAD-IA family hydrolase n=1 Tax=Actinomycetospora straminea TaxID=663607 RepID=A0ABP9DYT7_9PSEU|nr:HAD-IA family hydrolase [Actinomycetospora straminea]MDD7932383.1 HAD-IA family hydrolase [Actinomycetospora straminea]
MTVGPSCAPRPAGRGASESAPPDAVRAARRRALRRTRTTGGTLLLDMGGVVIPTLFESTAVPGFPAGPTGTDEDYRSVERGESQERDYWARLVARRPDIDIGALWRECSYVRGEVLGLVERLAGRVRVVAFTNDMAHWFGDDWPARFPAVARFDGVLEAAKLGVLKPDPAAFRAAADALAEDPGRCLFVDDLAANLDGARAAGMAAELFEVTDPAGSVARVARALGLPPDEPRRRRVWSP